MNRRCIRFIETIKKSKRLLFVRIKVNNNEISNETIENFKNAIYRINPNMEQVNLLLITNKNKQPNINNDFIITKYIENLTKGQRFENFEANKKQIEEFSNIMNDMGFQTNISEYKKNDKI
jgi:hypothetical protein